ncbi:MAG TPA: protein kinase [Verrucomicrobiae bacterium]|jgi:serine/threonine protein kinase|nr:protein kinase [Verrucomicrobiae bacterium]
MNIGDRVGDYEVVAVLGAGGMGQVYKVRNVLSERFEAMKVLLPSLEGDTELADRFLREIKVQAALDHPNIAKLYTALRASNQLLMVMEFVEGVSLERLLKHAQPLVHDVILYTSQVLDALAYAHAHGVIHRDIKPANIMRTPSGTIKLLDFGIARIKSDRKLTQTGATLGSIYYMSPEQIKGSEPDVRSDLYSLGVVLYEMVTGKRPFQGDSNYSIMAAHLQEIPLPPMEIVPWVQGPISDVVMKAIAKDPAERYQSAQEFRAALKNIVITESVQPADMAATKLMTDLPAATAPVAATPVSPTQATVVAATPQASRPVSVQPVATARTQPAVAIPPPPPSVATVQAQPEGQPVPIDQLPAGQAIPAAVVQKSGSRRGLYMVLGSILTLGVLVLAAMEVPKFLHTSANQSKKAQEIPAPSTQTQTPPAAQTTAQPSTGMQTTPATGDSQPTAQTASVATPGTSATQGTAATPGTSTTPGTSAGTPVTSATTPTTPATAQDTVPQTQTPATQPSQTKRKITSDASAATPPPASGTEIRELREKYNEVSVHAASAKDGLTSIRNQMAQQGLGLRMDVTEAEHRMDYMLKEAKSAIKKGDAEKARQSLTSAGYALETIQKFLGH